MTLRRWIADEFGTDTAALTGESARHLAVVLRAREGQEFAIACGPQLRLGTVTHVSPERVQFSLGRELPASAVLPVILLLSVFRFERLEWAIEKATELGVARIVPVVARRSDPHLGAAAGKRVERWRRLAKEAAQQSRRMAPPEIADPIALPAALKHCDSHLRLVLSESGQDRSLLQAVASADVSADVAIAVGPEGGWTADELRSFADSGWLPVSLGANILRTETAAIAALAILSQTNRVE